MKLNFTIEPIASRRRIAVLVLTASALALSPIAVAGFGFGTVLAQSTGGGHGGGKDDKGGHEDESHEDGGHSDGHDDDHAGAGGKKGGGHEDEADGGKGQGGKGEGGKGQGGQGGTGGSKPVWAQEGIPEVELGRLNVARSPDQVLQRAYDEALASLTPAMAGFYSMNLNEAIYALSTDFDNQTYIDSPLQNLALFKDALDGKSILNTVPQISNSNQTLMAVFLGVASDKTLPISKDTVAAITTILGSPLSDADSAALAADAEAVRIAVLAGHG